MPQKQGVEGKRKITDSLLNSKLPEKQISERAALWENPPFPKQRSSILDLKLQVYTIWEMTTEAVYQRH